MTQENNSLQSKHLVELYRYMVTAREIDILEEGFIQRGEAFFHVSGAGHEGTVALFPHLRTHDWLHCHYRDKALMLARGISAEMFFQSLFCKAPSHSNGRQMSAHISDPALNIMSIVGPVGNSALQAAGVATTLRDHADAPIVLCSLGDGMSQQGEVLEAIAHAVRERLPILFMIHDNHYAISTKTQGKTFFSLPEGQAEQFYGLPIQRIDGRDVIAADREFGCLLPRLREERTPALVVLDVERLSHHTNADDQRVYRSPEEIEYIQTHADPLPKLRAKLEQRGITTEALERLEHDIREAVAEAAHRAQCSPEPCPAFVAKKELPTALLDAHAEYRGCSEGPPLTMIEAMRNVLEERMRHDERVTLFGEDLEDPKGDVFRVTQGLTRKFPGRVQNSPLSESTILGVSIGRALAGERPVAFLQFADFLPLAYNQIFAELGSMHWRSNGGWEAPVIVMISCGAYRPGLGPFHASSLEALAAHTPGVDVFMPSTAADAAGMLNAAFESGRPTLFFYPKNCLNDRENTTSADVAQQFIPLGKARMVRQGDDLTLIGWGNTVALCEETAATLEAEGFSIDVIDMRSLSPWDSTTVLKSAEKTGRLIVAHEDNQSCGVGAEIIATIMELTQVPIKVRRITRPDTYVPCNFENQLAVLPSYQRILNAAADLLDLEIRWISRKPEQEENAFLVEAIGSSPSDESVTIIEFFVEVGQKIAVGDLLASLEADKAVQDLSAPVSGEVLERLVEEGDMVKVGTPILKLRTEAPVASTTSKLPTQEMPVIKRKEAPPANTTTLPKTSNKERSFQVMHTTQRRFKVGISTISTALGSRVVTNEHIVEVFPKVSAQEILKLTGIERRRWVGENETALSLGVSAARKVLQKAGVKVSELDLLLCTSGTPMFATPSMACLILHELSRDNGESHVQAYDVNAACAGYLYALQVAHDYLQNRPDAKVLLVTSETLSRKMNREDFVTAPIFGDGATATLLYGEAHAERIRAQLYRPVLSAKGENGSALRVPLEAREDYVSMSGRKVFTEAVRRMINMLNKACDEATIQANDLHLIVPHQANQRIIDAIRQRVKFPEDKVFSNIRNIGNTSSSSIPLCLEGLLQDRHAGEYLGLCAFGGGFTFGGAVLQIV